MARRDDNFGLLLAGGILLGAGLLAAASAQEAAQKKHQKFQEHLAQEVGAIGLRLMRLSIGRGPANEPFWDVAVADASGMAWFERVRLGRDADPYDPRALGQIVAQLTSTFEGRARGGAYA